MGPLVFLSTSEKQEGQIDAIFSPGSPGVYSSDDYADYATEGLFLNYTQIQDTYENEYNLAPRKQLWGSRYYLTKSNLTSECRITLI